MRSALLSVRGVTRADVAFATREAHVEYDAKLVSPDVLIRAVAAAKDPTMPNARFTAAVKQ